MNFFTNTSIIITYTIPQFSPPKFEVLKEVPIVEQPTMAEPEEVEKFRKLLEAWLIVGVSFVKNWIINFVYIFGNKG